MLKCKENLVSYWADFCYVFFLIYFVLLHFFFLSTRMHILLVLLCVCVAAAPGRTSLPTNGESMRNTIHSIISIAQITLVHIKKLRTKVCTLLYISIVYQCLIVQSVCLSLWFKESAGYVLNFPSLLL